MRNYVKNLVILVIVIAFIFSGCNNVSTIKSTTPPSSPEIGATANVSDYFPFNKNTYMKYKGSGNEYAEYETYVDFVEGNKIQLRNMNPGTTSARVYTIENGELTLTFLKGESYCRYNYIKQTNEAEVLLKEPLSVGTSWNLKEGTTRKISSINKKVKVDVGTYNCIEVTTLYKDIEQKDYYAKNVGLIKTESRLNSDNDLVISELEKIEKNIPFKQSVRLYFPDFDNDRVIYTERNISFLTNEDVKFKLQKELKTIPENTTISKLLTPNTQINSIVLDDENQTVTIDLSKHFINEMNAGSDFEAMILKSIVNTLGDYYQREKVIITISGEPYESGHIGMKLGEAFNVDMDGVVEYKKQ